ncbi:MAG: hypothetical protein RLZZ293_1055 [Pseudomonadota bacterium]|jgi:3-deoxy-D-manno-octulosonate 8-phosphate phosphatase (KDO 8-P phosphatase)
MLSSELIKHKAQSIKLIVTDVDGVLTEGYVFIQPDANEAFGKFNILDGFAVHMAHKCGLKTAVISGRKSEATEARCAKLGFDFAYTGILDKHTQLVQLAKQLELEFSEIAYIGDDWIDLPVLTKVGLSCAPANAVEEILNRVDYISSFDGGKGVFRNLVELILRHQNKYDQLLQSYLV